MSESNEGFEVVTARNGKTALEELEANAIQFKAVITDTKLGKGSDGWEIGHRARELVSGSPVIYVSGDSAQEWSANGVPESVMLQKPFVIAQLITAVTTLLNASNAPALGDAVKQRQQAKTFRLSRLGQSGEFKRPEVVRHARKVQLIQVKKPMPSPRWIAAPKAPANDRR